MAAGLPNIFTSNFGNGQSPSNQNGSAPVLPTQEGAAGQMPNTPLASPAGGSLANSVEINPEEEEKLFRALVKRGRSKFYELSKLNDLEEQAIVNHILNDFWSTDAASRQYKNNLTEMLGNWRGTTTEKDFPFDNCANVRVPLTATFVETMRARQYKSLFGGDRISRVSRLDKTYPNDDIEEFNQWFQWELIEVVSLKQVARDILHNTLIYGTDVSIPFYKHEEDFLHSFKEFEETGGQSASLSAILEKALQEIVSEPSSWGTEDRVEVLSETGLGDYKLNDGGRITFSIAEETGRLRADIWKRETTFDGAQIEQIQMENLVCPNTAADINDIPFFGVRLWYSADRYRKAVENKFFIDYGEKENTRILQNFDLKVGELVGQQMTELQDAESGTDSLDLTATWTPTRRYGEIYRWEGYWVWDKTGADYSIEKLIKPASHIAVWVAVRAKRVVKIARVEDLNKDAKRSGILTRFIREPGRFFGIGLAEWVRHMQTVMDAVYNQRLDSGLLYNVPFGWYKPASGLAKNAEPIRIEPGVFQPTADPTAINMPRSNWQPTFDFAEEQLAFKYATLLAGLTDPALGVMASKRSSATEIAGVAQAIDTRSEEIVESLCVSVKCYVSRVLSLYQQFAPRQRIFRVGGEKGEQVVKQFESDRLRGKFHLELEANLQQLNDQLVRQVDMDMLELLLNEILIQSGITGPDTIHAAIAKLAKDMNYTGVPLHKPNLPPMSDPPEYEEKQMFMGQKPTGPTLGENAAEHMQHHAMTAADNKLMVSWSPQARQILQQHIQETIQIQKAQQIVAQQKAAMATQMRMSMNSKGVRPGQSGGQNAGNSTGAGSQQEGVQGAGVAPTNPTPPLQ